METYVRSLLATERQSELFSQVPALILITKTIQKLLIAQLPISDRPEGHYFRTGKCRYGAKCLFRHTDPTLVQAQSTSCNLCQDKPSAFQHSPYSLSNHKILNNEPRNMQQPKRGNKPEKAHHVQTEKEEATLTESHATPTERALNKIHTSSLYARKDELSTSSPAAPRSPKQLQPTSTPSHPKPLDPLSLNAMFASCPSNGTPPPPKRSFSSANYSACLSDELRRDRDNNSSGREEFDHPEGSGENSTTPWTSVKGRRRRRGPPPRDEIEKAVDETHRLCKDCGECFLLAGYKRNRHTSTHTPQHPSQEWRGAAETRAQTHTPTPHTPASSGSGQAERANQHTHTPTPRPGVAGPSRNPSPSTHTHAAHPSQEWRGTGGARTPTPTPQDPSQEWRGAAKTGAHTHTPTPHTRARRAGVQGERPHQHAHTPTPQPGEAGYEGSAHTSIHTPQHPSQEWRGAAEIQTQTRTPTPHAPASSAGVQGEHAQQHAHPNTQARSGGARPNTEPKHAHALNTPQPGVAGYRGSTRTNTHTPQRPSQEWRGAAETRAQAHTPTPHTPARSGGVKGERPHQHTHTPTPEPGVAGRSRNPNPNTRTHAARPSQEWRGTRGARTHTRTPKHPSQVWRGAARTRAQTHTPTPHTPARSGGVQAEPAYQHTHSPTPQPGVVGRNRNPSPSTHTHTTYPSQERQGTRGARTQTCTRQHPSQEWRGAAETRAQTHTPTPHTPAGSGGVQAERAHKHTQAHRTSQPGEAGYKGSTHTSTHTPQHPSQEWRGATETRAQAHTHTAHPSQEWRGTGGARTQTRTPQHPSQEWRGAAETRAQTHTPTPHGPARSGREQGEHAHKHAHTSTPARSGGAQPKPEPKHTHPHRRPQPGVAGYKRSAHTNTHRHSVHPGKERRGTREAPTPAHTHPNIPARSRGAQPKPEPKHTRPHRAPQPGVAGYKGSTHTNTHTPTTQPGVAGRSRNPSPNTHTHTAHPSQEWWGTNGARTRAKTHPNTPARSGGAQRKPKPKQIHPRRTPQPGVAGYKGSTHTNTHTPTPQQGLAGHSRNPSPNTHTHTSHPSQEWRGTRGARTPAHTHPITPARSGGAQPKPEPKHTHPRRTPQPGVAGCKQSTHTSTHKPRHPSQEWRAAAEIRAQAHAPKPHTPARSGGVQVVQAPSTHTPQYPSQEWRGAAETPTQPQPRPKCKRHATVGNPASIARALRQPVPCR